MKFDKVALDEKEQLDLLIKRGLCVKNKESAKILLKRIGYYHLSSYMRNFQEGENHQFKPNTYFSQIIDLYNFDKELRHITFEAIEKIELAYRAAISNVMCKTFSSHWFYNFNAFKNESKLKMEIKNVETFQEKTINLILDEIKKKKKSNEYAETFIAKYYEKYSEPDLPPFWMVIETFSLGSLNRLYWVIKDEYKREIVRYLGFKEDVSFIALHSNWLQPLCLVRNICAHHSRLYNRIFKIKAKQHKKIEEFVIADNNRFYYVAMIINYYLRTILQDGSFETNLRTLFHQYSHIDKTKLGFPEYWDRFSITLINKKNTNS